MLPQHAPIFRCPREVLIEIAVALALADPIGPPTDLLSLLLTCKQMYYSLHLDRQLYARVFNGQFDTRAAGRRLGQSTMWAQHLTAQLKRYWLTLRSIQTRDIFTEHLEEDLWTAFVMCLENDGKNEAQLSWANLDSLLEQFMQTRLLESRESFNNWPAESTINSLAIWLYWLRLDNAKLTSKSKAERNQLKDLIRPYTFTALRYPCFFAPDNHFVFPLSRDMSRVAHLIFVTPHGYYPLYRQPSECVETIDLRGTSSQIAVPLLGLGAKLLYLTLHEEPLNVDSTAIIDREHALQQGITDVKSTQADIIEVNSSTSVQLLPTGDWDWRSKLNQEQGEMEDACVWRKGLKAKSAALDELWGKMMYCWNPWEPQILRGIVYVYGTMSGLWKGRMLTPDVDQYFALVTSESCPNDISDQNPHVMTSPVYMNLREYHCIMPEEPVAHGGTEEDNDDGILNAWFPEVKMRERGRFLYIQDETTRREHKYELYVEGRENSHDPETCTVCKGTLLQDSVQAAEDLAEQTAAESVVAITHDRASAPPEVVDRTREEVDAALADDADVDDLAREVSVESSDEVEAMTADDDASEDSELYVENTCSGICDIVIIGETLPRHGQAWHHYRFYGRVRSWDGLVALVRVPVHNPNLGTYIFRGYIVAGNFVGSWRLRTHNPRAIPVEGPFALSKT